MITEEIQKLKAERGAVVLAHNYCLGDVQDAADFTGDSLELARKATEIEAETIVFCGVYFMAETAKILNPTKRVLIPDPTAGCPMADMITADQLRAMKAKRPGAKAVCYVNSTAAVKAECDICVTSGNAEKVMATLKGEEVIFVPDQHLGGYVSKKLGEAYTCWPGYCPIHAALSLGDIAAGRREAGMDAPVLVHPECSKEVREAADQCLSTGGMCRFVAASEKTDFVIGTEEGILHRLRKENPDKTFTAIGKLRCADMKKITLEKLRDSLRDLKHEVVVDETVAVRARTAIERMLNLFAFFVLLFLGTLVSAPVLAETEEKPVPESYVGAATLTVEPSVAVKPIKVMNAGNNAPLDSERHGCWNEFRALKIPYARTHDIETHYAYGEAFFPVKDGALELKLEPTAFAVLELP